MAAAPSIPARSAKGGKKRPCSSSADSLPVARKRRKLPYDLIRTSFLEITGGIKESDLGATNPQLYINWDSIRYHKHENCLSEPVLQLNKAEETSYHPLEGDHLTAAVDKVNCDHPHILSAIRRAVKPLTLHKAGKKNIWEAESCGTTYKLDRRMQIAFLRDMEDSRGRAALQTLCEEIQNTDKDFLSVDVLSVGHSSSRDSIGRKIKFSFEVMDTSDSNASSDAQYSDGLSQHSIKTFVPDIVVENIQGNTVKIYLLISLKKGFSPISLSASQAAYEFQLEMAAFLTYQKEIFGLQVYANCAQLYHMEKDEEKLHFTKVNTYVFTSEYQHFQVEDLVTMTNDLIKVFYKMKDADVEEIL